MLLFSKALRRKALYYLFGRPSILMLNHMNLIVKQPYSTAVEKVFIRGLNNPYSQINP
jgi:hypothetical protein